MSELKDTSRLCIHSITTKPWSLSESIPKFAKVGVPAISIWQDAAEAIGMKETSELVKGEGLDVVSYVRGGFFAATEEEQRQKAIDHNKRMIDDASAVGAPLLVLVCGADPGQSMQTSRDQIQKSIETLIPHAEANGVKLGIEPLHPMYSDTRSAIVNLAQSNDIAEAINDKMVGVVLDVYHLWWDDLLKQQIDRCGEHQNIFAFHTCDWNVPTEDMLNDRGLMGDGCIPTKQIREWVDDAGFDGYIEVEVFSKKYWSGDQDVYLKNIVEAYKKYA